jgi:hypothetical protein
MPLEFRDLRARIERLDRLARGLAKEVGLQRGAENVLLFRERRQYLRAVQEALAGAEAARVVLAGVVKRLQGDCRRRRGHAATAAVAGEEVPAAPCGAPAGRSGRGRVRASRGPGTATPLRASR